MLLCALILCLSQQVQMVCWVLQNVLLRWLLLLRRELLQWMLHHLSCWGDGLCWTADEGECCLVGGSGWCLHAVCVQQGLH